MADDDAASAVRSKLKKVGQAAAVAKRNWPTVGEQQQAAAAKVKRYWPGKAPAWAEEPDEHYDLREALNDRDEQSYERPIVDVDDARIRRLQESRRDREDAVARHRQIRAAEIVSTENEERGEEEKRQEEEEGEEDDDAIEERRRRIKERLLQKQKEEELPEEDEEEEEEEEEEESEYETDSEDDVGGRALVKPVFVPKAERETVAEREKMEEEELALQEMVKKKIEERKLETKQLVVEEIRKDEQVELRRETEGDGGVVDTDDEVDEEEMKNDYEAWKGRELGRLRRDRGDRETSMKEKDEVDKLRAMTEEERREWERKNPKQNSIAPKKKWNFMQKYYHKGAFFQDQADDTAGTAGGDKIYGRDYSEPTGEDKVDKSSLPKIMQVKHFGRSGRTKWTHLVNEDTTQWDNPWMVNDPLRFKYNSKMAGMDRPLEKPKGKKYKNWE